MASGLLPAPQILPRPDGITVSVNTDDKQTLAFGRDVLGPIIYRYCYKLWLLQGFYDREQSTLLFLARGGFRLHYFYELFNEQNDLAVSLPIGELLVSRMAAYKAALHQSDSFAIDQVVEEYCWYPVREFMDIFFGTLISEPWYRNLDPDLQKWFLTQPLNHDILNRILSGEWDGQQVIGQHLQQQNKLFKQHIEQVSDHRANLILVDTGWGGSIIRALKPLLPERNIVGGFFGRFSYQGKHSGDWFNDIIGLEVEGDDYARRQPASVIFLHRHLIEGICEVNWPSVTGYCMNSSGRVTSMHGEFPESARKPSIDEPLAMGVQQYMETTRSLDLAAINEAARLAIKRLRKAIIFPGLNETRYTVESRSADFGKQIDVPVLLPPARTFSISGKLSNIRQSLWPYGQIALEFPKSRMMVQLLYLYTGNNQLTRKFLRALKLT